jgi:hypothetical protein
MAASVASLEKKVPEWGKNLDGDVEFFNQENLMKNMKMVTYVRTLVVIAGGVITGILGYTGLAGFLCYLLVFTTGSLALLSKMGFNPSQYTSSGSLFAFVFDGVFSQQLTLSFLLFWTLFFALVHIY